MFSLVTSNYNSTIFKTCFRRFSTVSPPSFSSPCPRPRSWVLKSWFPAGLWTAFWSSRLWSEPPLPPAACCLPSASARYCSLVPLEGPSQGRCLARFSDLKMSWLFECWMYVKVKIFSFYSFSLFVYKLL